VKVVCARVGGEEDVSVMSGRQRGWVAQNVPSWRGKRGRLAAAKEWRRTRLEAISIRRAG
jgi:hypothetical protein